MGQMALSRLAEAVLWSLGAEDAFPVHTATGYPPTFARILLLTTDGGRDAVGQLQPATGPAVVPHNNMDVSAEINGHAAAELSSSQAVVASSKQQLPRYRRAIGMNGQT